MPLPDLVDAAWLAEHVDEVVVADVRWGLLTGPDREGFEAGHIPGAVFVDLETVLAAPVGSGPGRHPLPTPDAFADALGTLGVGTGVPVVAYDASGGANAARLWWMLRAIGEECAVLDGGLGAWPGDLETGPGTTPEPVVRAAVPWPADRIVDANRVRALSDAGAVVLDARAGERYRGEVEPVDPAAGHIPGALSAPFADNLDEQGRFRSPAELRRRFDELGALDTAVVVYCGSGVTACHDLLALEVAGVTGALLYEGSWSDWCRDPTRPVASGADP